MLDATQKQIRRELVLSNLAQKANEMGYDATWAGKLIAIQQPTGAYANAMFTVSKDGHNFEIPFDWDNHKLVLGIDMRPSCEGADIVRLGIYGRYKLAEATHEVSGAATLVADFASDLDRRFKADVASVRERERRLESKALNDGLAEKAHCRLMALPGATDDGHFGVTFDRAEPGKEYTARYARASVHARNGKISVTFARTVDDIEHAERLVAKQLAAIVMENGTGGSE